MSSRYLHGNIDHGLHIQSASGFSLTSFSDTDWSTNSFYVFLGPSIVSWSSPKQKDVARSNTLVWIQSIGSCGNRGDLVTSLTKRPTSA